MAARKPTKKQVDRIVALHDVNRHLREFNLPGKAVLGHDGMVYRETPNGKLVKPPLPSSLSINTIFYLGGYGRTKSRKTRRH